MANYGFSKRISNTKKLEHHKVGETLVLWRLPNKNLVVVLV